MNQRHAATLIPADRATLRYRDPQDVLRVRLRGIGRQQVRYGYRRLTAMLKREGWNVSAKRIYSSCIKEGLIVRTQIRSRQRRGNRLP